MYRKNEQFLKASQQYYNKYCQGTCECNDKCNKDKCHDSCECKDTCNKDSCYDPCECKGNCNQDQCCDSCECDVCKDYNTPKTIIDVLCSLINEQIQVTTPFGNVTGTLLDVKSDYIVILEDTGAQVLVRTDKIESVSPTT